MRTTTLSILFLLDASAARAACPDFAAGLKGKMQEYASYRARNLEQLGKDLGTEKSCRDLGTEISARIAKLADAKSCRAELDTHGIDGKMNQLGGDCEGSFRKIHEVQEDLRARFKVVKQDLQDVLAFLDESHVLDRECGPELSFAHQAFRKFIQLESDILAVDTRSLDGQTNYGKFKDTAAQLKALTGARGGGCEAMATTVSGALKAAGAGARVPASTTPKSQSDITGLKKDPKP